MNLKELNSEERYSQILKLQKELNQELISFFESTRKNGRDHLSRVLIDKVESMIDTLNNQGYKFGRIDYGGDINYENSEQWYSNGDTMGRGIILHFHGFSVQASWDNA